MKRKKGLETNSPTAAGGDLKLKKLSASGSGTTSSSEHGYSKKASENRDNVIQVSYILDKVKCLHKKCADTSANKSVVEIKGTALNPQIKVKCNAGFYEIVKIFFPKYIDEMGLFLENKYVKDRSGLVVSFTSTIWNSKIRNGNALYSINFFNSTSTMLINRTKDVDVFLRHYTDIIESIPCDQSVRVNAEIKKSCMNALSELKSASSKSTTTKFRSAETNSASNVSTASRKIDLITPICATSFNSTSSCVIKTQPSTTSIASFTKQNVALNSDNSVHSAVNSKSDSIDEQKHADPSSVDGQQLFNLQLLVRLQQLEDAVKIIPSLQKSIIDMKVHAKSLEDKVCSLSADNVRLMKNSFSARVNNSWPTPDQSSNRLYGAVQHLSGDNVSRKLLSAKDINDSNTSTENFQHRNNNFDTPVTYVNNTQKTMIASKRVAFDHSKCVVIKVDPAGKCIRNLDEIRRAVSKVKDGVAIDNISRSSINNLRQFMVQLTDEFMVTDVVNNWDNTLFGKSSARKTSLFKQENCHIGVVKAVPLDLTDEFIKSDLSSYDIVNCRRILKNRKPTRCVQVDFKSAEGLKNAIENRVKIDNMSCKVDIFNFSPRLMQCYSCFRYGHFSVDCSDNKKCRNCSRDYHGKECHYESKCINCASDHGASAVECPIRQRKYESALRRNSRFSAGVSSMDDSV